LYIFIITHLEELEIALIGKAVIAIQADNDVDLPPLNRSRFLSIYNLPENWARHTVII
jgi:hypothetical protein